MLVNRRPAFIGQMHVHHRRTCVVMHSRIHKSLDTQLKSVLDKPEDVTLECLTQLRRPDLERLQPFIRAWHQPPRSDAGMLASDHHTARTHAAQAPLLTLGDKAVLGEDGPLAACAPFMDAAARRVLPGHLLRRCRILSTFQLGTTCQQRVALTSCTGEEVVTVWKLIRLEAPVGGSDATSSSLTHAVHPDSSIPGSHGTSTAAPASASLSSSSTTGPMHQQHHAAAEAVLQAGSTASDEDRQTGAGNGSESDSEGRRPPGFVPATMWLVDSISRDDSNDEADIASVSKPHPRLSPELVVKCQLAALRRGDVPGAAVFNMWGRSLMGNWESQLVAFRSKLRQMPYHNLLTHEDVELGMAALPTQRQFMQCVKLRLPSPGGKQLALEAGDTVEFVFTLGMQANGCWMVTSIIPK